MMANVLNARGIIKKHFEAVRGMGAPLPVTASAGHTAESGAAETLPPRPVLAYPYARETGDENGLDQLIGVLFSFRTDLSLIMAI
jgi:hypothetical protein